MKNKLSFFVKSAPLGEIKAFRKIFVCSIVFTSVFFLRFVAEKERLSFSFAIAASEATQIEAVATTVAQDGIDVNSADAEGLQVLPGVGPKLADAIIKSRKTDGPFLKASDLLRVKGIGAKKLEKMMPYLRFVPSENE
ncbi:MAG: helix-hairpin-helix domain-containing protein [Verrucomicrobia bacterium]|nr:helix-hairpin-helix domain-containing protein [Verrucomicrobiota bacterium]